MDGQNCIVVPAFDCSIKTFEILYKQAKINCISKLNTFGWQADGHDVGFFERALQLNKSDVVVERCWVELRVNQNLRNSEEAIIFLKFQSRALFSTTNGHRHFFGFAII